MASSNVLAARDANAKIKQTGSPEKKQTKSLDYHRQVLHSRLNEQQ